MQEDLPFSEGGGPDGLAAWRAARDGQLRDLGRVNGLPLGHVCRVELAGGVVLQGMLRLADQPQLWVEVQRDVSLRLRIDRCVFSPGEVVWVVRLD